MGSPLTPHQRLQQERLLFFAAALEFQKLWPWDWMNEFQIVGVQAPGRTEPDWCQVTGTDIGAPGVFVQMGAKGFALLRRLQADDLDTDDLLADRDSFSIVYEFASDVGVEYRREVDATNLPFDRDLGLPLLRRHRDGVTRTRLEFEDVRLARCVLEQLMDVALRLKAGTLDVIVDEQDRRFVRVGTGDADAPTWSDARVVVSPLPPRVVPPCDPSLMAALAGKPRTPQRMWELDTFALPVDVELKSGGHSTPFIVVIVDVGAESLIEEIETTPATRFADARSLLERHLKRSASLPDRVHVARAELAEYLRPVVAAAGIELALETELPIIEAFRLDIEEEFEQV